VRSEKLPKVLYEMHLYYIMYVESTLATVEDACHIRALTAKSKCDILFTARTKMCKPLEALSSRAHDPQGPFGLTDLNRY
jgi:hypothetical protein